MFDQSSAHAKLDKQLKQLSIFCGEGLIVEYMVIKISFFDGDQLTYFY